MYERDDFTKIHLCLHLSKKYFHHYNKCRWKDIKLNVMQVNKTIEFKWLMSFIK